MKIAKKANEYSRLIRERDSILRYREHVAKIKQQESKRLGYPVVGAIDESDYALGIVPGSIFDIYLNNIGNPYDIPHSFHHHAKIFEQESIALCAQYLGLDQSTRGYITSGGTEGNFAGMWWAREYALKQSQHARMPKLLISTAAHYSIVKAGNQLALEVCQLKATPRGSIDIKILEESLRNHPIDQAVIIVATLGTTQTGGMDDVLAIRDLLDTHIIARGGVARLHIDAALLGLALPIISPSMHLAILAAADSIAISAHKLLASRMMISGIVLTSGEYLTEVFAGEKNTVSYIGDIQDITVSGSRSGSAAIALHHRLMQLEFNKEGAPLKDYVLENMRLARYFHDELVKIIPRDQILLGDNLLTLVFPRPVQSTELIQQYSLMPVDHDKLGVCVLSHVTKNMIDNFIVEYRGLI
jgi:histidine decarboxylase